MAINKTSLITLIRRLPFGVVAAALAFPASSFERDPIEVAPGVYMLSVDELAPTDRTTPWPGGDAEDRSSRIVGGTETTITSWPWQTGIAIRPSVAPGTGFERQFCGGSLVTPTFVITAPTAFSITPVAAAGRVAIVDDGTCINNYVVRVEKRDDVGGGDKGGAQDVGCGTPFGGSSPTRDESRLTHRPGGALVRPGDLHRRGAGGGAQPHDHEVEVEVFIDPLLFSVITGRTTLSSSEGQEIDFDTYFVPAAAGVIVHAEAMVCAGLPQGGVDSCQGRQRRADRRPDLWGRLPPCGRHKLRDRMRSAGFSRRLRPSRGRSLPLYYREFHLR